MTVYVPQQPKPNKHGWHPDLSSAADYGKIEFVFSADERPASDLWRCLTDASIVLADFDPDKDYLCWPYSGDPVSLYISIMVLVYAGCEKIQFLNWNRKRDAQGNNIKGAGYYAPIAIELHPALKGAEEEDHDEFYGDYDE